MKVRENKMSDEFIELLTRVTMNENFNDFIQGKFDFKFSEKNKSRNLKDKLADIIVNTLSKVANKKILDENSIYYLLFQKDKNMNQRQKESKVFNLRTFRIIRLSDFFN